MDLAKQHCVSCKSGVKPFSRKKAEDYLKMVRNWELLASQGDSWKPMRIQRKFVFKNFQGALSFVNPKKHWLVISKQTLV
ncbi:hypothetical protein A3F00_04165 [Candidatus Daviesbacteria bacterium RIFCSPHIGHO2_12_FULL_37_11]|uniref:Uncharacterized protein n=1 Tax=Candidatus Daviesbacteria bacterium RIFCSPHIGHO2_12_FULL_37_11 TaxID=1797777 RepID=A0A1F5KE75_9BACT|nr:MAG: hypothetical protein A2111_00600 [Candidatus Daviesbacteria bacterium GWA1_38_6]OGE18128.1 MAG: hypothetical protein A2769_02680 [Candidatus Daviesbacteria bacterium RIFCSPHIGHO2_01_FULL_37_27]OGE39252.1 MAG: hypothetical protein A3F00_04165 [Candidatus Daviesbacteria bacterium RIFCSPHIGHO2_12_FULL_37_11]OGE45630.1 MAG: hypothetical protein A3B39_00555 [Candidatus Daviesbacteria bacterium RIFCSPLOWO2_01_FULL_37_10]